MSILVPVLVGRTSETLSISKRSLKIYESIDKICRRKTKNLLTGKLNRIGQMVKRRYQLYSSLSFFRWQNETFKTFCWHCILLSLSLLVNGKDWMHVLILIQLNIYYLFLQRLDHFFGICGDNISKNGSC